jgi:hypothetical protein
VERYGEDGRFNEDHRLYIVNEIAVQAIGAGNMTVTFFGAFPFRLGRKV